jgi:hypothetical protein
LGEDVQPLQFADGLGRKCPGAQEYNGNGDALLLQLDQQIEAGLLRQDDDDVDIDGVAERAEQRAAIAETPDDEALPGQFAGQGLAVDQVAIEEKDANRICLADRAMQLPRSVARGYDILFKHRRHLKTLSSFARQTPQLEEPAGQSCAAVRTAPLPFTLQRVSSHHESPNEVPQPPM